MRILGIDPGKSGAAAVLDGGRVLDAIDIPLADDEVDVLALADWIQLMKPEQAWIELVHPMPSAVGTEIVAGFGPIDTERRSMGASSAFYYGGAVYAIRATVTLCGVKRSLVTPGVWKKHFGLKGGKHTTAAQRKEQSRLRALEMWPQAAGLLARKRDAGRAEAMLIAKYGAFGSKVEFALEQQWGAPPKPAPTGRPEPEEVPE